jgi:transcriptional regulator with XRE-family HTH domain
MKLKTYMTENGLTARDMAERINGSMRTVQKWVSGERIPRPDQMRKLTDATNGQVTANDFFGEPASSENAA